MSKVAIWFTVTILLVYFVFTSGFYYWVTGCNDVMILDTPYSWALSARDNGVTGIASDADLDCVDWLLTESDQDVLIACDSNALYLISGYTELIANSWEQYGKRDRLIPMGKTPEPERCYIFMTEWNTRNSKYIVPTGVGLRRSPDIVFDGHNIFYDTYDSNRPGIIYSVVANVIEVYRCGSAVVVEKGHVSSFVRD